MFFFLTKKERVSKNFLSKEFFHEQKLYLT